MHNNLLVERNGKISKSSGEFLRVQLLIDKGYHPLAYRLMCLQAHSRSELEFSWEEPGSALTRLKRRFMASTPAREAEAAPLPDLRLPALPPRFDQNGRDPVRTSVTHAHTLFR